MPKYLLALLLALGLWSAPALAQTVTNPAQVALVCAYSASPPAPVDGQYYYVQCDSTGKLITSAASGNVTACSGGTAPTSGQNAYWTSAVDICGRTGFSVPTDAQTGATYTIPAADNSGLVTFTRATAVAVTLPQATSPFTTGWNTTMCNLGVGDATITPTTSTINGQASQVLHQYSCLAVVSNGVNYSAVTTLAPNSGGNLPVTSLNSGTSASSSTFWRGDGTWAAAGTGTVTSVSVTTANGVSGSVATATTTPAITLTLGAITPTTVAIGGCTIGSLALCTTGPSTLNESVGSSALTLTGATQTASHPVIDATQTWNANATFKGLSFNMTKGGTTPSVLSGLLDLSIGGSTYFRVGEGAASYATMWLNTGITPSGTNYSIQYGAGSTYINSPASGGNLTFVINNGNNSFAIDGIGNSDGHSNVVVGKGALATNATEGFLYIPGCGGTPAGTPRAYTGRYAICYDATTSHQLYIYDAAWLQPKTPAAAAIVTWQ